MPVSHTLPTLPGPLPPGYLCSHSGPCSLGSTSLPPVPESRVCFLLRAFALAVLSVWNTASPDSPMALSLVSFWGPPNCHCISEAFPSYPICNIFPHKNWFYPQHCFILLHIALIFKFIFHWRIIALQRCPGFCCRTMWVINKYTDIPSLRSLPPTPLPPPWPTL